MNEPQKTLVRQWILRAEHDLLNVTNNLDAQQTPWDTVCFHCQQAAEKYLKTVLTIHRQAIPLTHDLEQLMDLALVWLPDLEGAREDLRWLTVYAVTSRYPVEVMGDLPGEKEGRRAHGIALSVREVCRACMQQIDPDFERDA